MDFELGMDLMLLVRMDALVQLEVDVMAKWGCCVQMEDLVHEEELEPLELVGIGLAMLLREEKEGKVKVL